MKFKHVAALAVALILMVAVTAGFAGDEGTTPTEEEMEIMESHHPVLSEQELEEMNDICYGEEGDSGMMGGHHNNNHHNNMMGF